jgi:PAS domain S-box-containing protein
MIDKSNPLQHFDHEELLGFLEEGLVITDLEGKILSLNKAGSVIFGYGNNLELVDKNFRDLFWKPEEFSTFLDTIRKTGEIQEYLIFGRKRDGRPAYIQACSRLHPRGAENPDAIATLFKDISERELFRRALERADDRYKTLFNTISEGYARFSADNQVVFINPAGAKILGFNSPMEVLGKQILEAWQDPMAWIDFKQRLAEKGEIENEKVELELHDGRRVTIEITERVVRNRDGQVVGSDALFRDITEQHALQERLTESAQKLHEIVSSCAEIMLVADTAGKITFVNNAYSGILGFAMDEAIGKPLGYATFPEDRERLEAAVKEVLQGRPITNFDLRIIRRDGVEVRTSWSASALKDIAGRVKGIIAVGRDVTESRKAEEALRESERFLASVFDSIQDGISILDKDLNIVSVNQAIEKWYAHAMPLVGKKCYEAYHLRAEACSPCPTLRVLETGKAAYEVVPRIGEGGQIVGWQDLYSFPLFDTATGALKGVIEYVRDITKRVEAEKRLRLMSSAVEQTTEGIGVCDLKGAILFVNRAAAQMHGFTPQELIGKNVSLLHDEEQMPAALAARKHVVETGAFTGEIWHIRRDGAPFLAFMRQTLIRDEEGFPVGIIATVRDVSRIEDNELALLKERDFSQRIIENANNIVLTYDTEGRITTFNRFAEELTGYSRAEVLGKDYIETFIPLRDRKAQRQGLKNVVKGAPPFTGVNPIVCKDGVERIILWTTSLFTDKDGSVTGVLSIGKDMTERLTDIGRVYNEVDLSNAILDASAAFLLVADRDGKIRRTNDALARLTGFTADELLGRTIWETVIPPQAERESRQRFASLFREVKRTIIERPIRTKSGEMRDVIWCCDFMRDNAGQPLYIVAMGTDITDTADLRRRIQRSESLYQSLVDNSPDIIARTDPNGIITFSGGAVKQLLGYEPAEGLGHQIADFSPPEDRKAIEDAIARGAKGEGVENFITRIVTKSGGVIHVSANARAIRDEKGEIVEFQITSRDISPLIRLQEQLKQYSEDLEKLIEKRTLALRDSLAKRAEEESYTAQLIRLAPLACMGTDENVLMRRWNEAANEMFGYSAEEVLGKSPAILVPPERMDDFRRVIAETGRGHAVKGFETVCITKDGRRIEVKLDAMSLVDSQGKLLRGLCLVEDITQKKAARREIEDARNRLNIILGEITEYGIFSTDANFVINYFGPGCERLTGWKAQDVVGQKDAHIIKPAPDSGPVVHALHETFIGGAPASEVLTIRRKDGSTIDVTAVVKPILDKNGVMQGLVAVLRDITSEREAVDRLFEEARHKALGAMVAGLASEFNAILARLEQHTAMAKNDPGFIERCTAGVREEIRRARTLVDNLTRFMHPAQQPFALLDPVKVIDEVADMLQSEFQLSGVRLVKTYHRVSQTLMRRDDIQHALLNLLLASLASAGKGGAVEIIVQQDAAAISFTVKDNGQGISPEDLSHAFDPQFWTKAPPAARQARGLTASLGLGLISAKKTAEEHGGAVEIESESGVGTTLRVKLPVKTTRRGRKTTRLIPRPPVPETLPLKILIADDETHVRAVIAYIAKEKNHICESATSLPEARNLCADRRFDVILLDHGLGDQAGLAATIAAAKSSSPRARIYIIVDDPSELTGALHDLCDGALNHSFSIEDIQRLLAPK